MTAHWRQRLIQIAFVLALALALPAAAATVTLECDPIECAQQCGYNQGLCAGQQGVIIDDCSGDCLDPPEVNTCDGGECDYCLTCSM